MKVRGERSARTCPGYSLIRPAADSGISIFFGAEFAVTEGPIKIFSLREREARNLSARARRAGLLWKPGG